MLKFTIPFAPIDTAFGNFFANIADDEKMLMGHTARIASWSTRDGNICINLEDFASKHILDEYHQREFSLPSVGEWRKALWKSGLVARPGEYKPLVLDEANRLYLHRYWIYEQNIASFFRKRMSPDSTIRAFPHEYWARARATLDNIFPALEGKTINWQKIAAALAIIKNTLIITGGPGTGKTTTAAKIIAVLLTLTHEKKMRVALAAPTGKAALRLSESVKVIKESMACLATIKDKIPETSFTLHRLLGYGSGLRIPQYNHRNPLPYDLLIVDEASMIDLPLMANLVEALKPSAKLILLGDKNQLASVEPGAFFGDLNEALLANAFSEETATLLELLIDEKMPIPTKAMRYEGVIEMKDNHRFGNNHPLAALSTLITAGKATEALEFVRAGHPNLRLVENSESGQLQAAIKEELAQYLKACRRKRANDELFDVLENFRILAAIRGGRNGVEAINKSVSSFWSSSTALIQGKVIFDCCPIMATRNNYQQGIFNGDVGIVFMDEGGNYQAHFRSVAKKTQQIPLASIDGFEIAFATTVHKAQGSEFKRVLLRLPETDSPALTREVIYTAITRAKESVEIWGNAQTLWAALGKRVTRKSALRELLG